jgi:hypothetical protein
MTFALNGKQIYEILNSDDYSHKIFKAVLPRDKLPNKVKYPSAYIINTQGSSHPGEHWLAIYYDKNGNCDFFDSFGLNPAIYGFIDFLNKTCKKWNYNNKQIQSLMSEFCGYYCTYFILLRSRNIPMECILNFFDNKDFFKNDYRIMHLLLF